MGIRTFFLVLAVSAVTSTAFAQFVDQCTILDTCKELQCSPLKQIDDPEFPVGCSGIKPVRTPQESQVALLINGDISLRQRLYTLRNAKHSIRIQALIFAGDESGRYIARILKEKAAQKDERGNPLDVRVIVDSMSNLNPRSQLMYFDLMTHGVQVEGYEAFYLEFINEKSKKDAVGAGSASLKRYNMRYHDKLWIIDGEDADGSAVMGGLNIANEYFRVDKWHKDGANMWRDQDVALRGPIIKDLVKAFDDNFAYFKAIKNQHPYYFNTDNYRSLWVDEREALAQWLHKKYNYNLDNWDFLNLMNSKYFQKYVQDDRIVKRVEWADHNPPNTTAKYGPKEVVFEPALSRMVQSRPRMKETYIEQAYVDLFDHAQSEIIIVNAYFLPPQPVTDAIRRALHRGVKITILTNSLETNDLPQLAIDSRLEFWSLLQMNHDPETVANRGQLEIHEWNGDTKRDGTVYSSSEKKTFQQGTIHAKFGLFDRKRAIVGSFNLDPRSERLNSETAIVFENTDMVERLRDFVVNGDMKSSVVITEQKAWDWLHPKSTKQKVENRFAEELRDLM